MIRRYEDLAVRARLQALPRLRAAVFAAACAELLVPIWPRYARLTQQSRPGLLRDSVDALWSALDGATVDLRPLLEEVTRSIPDEEDDPWVFVSGHAQNAAIAVAHAIETWLDGDAGDAEGAAVMVWEASDLSAENSDESPRFSPSAAGTSTADSTVGAALDLIDGWLSETESGDVDAGALRTRSRGAADLWWSSLRSRPARRRPGASDARADQHPGGRPSDHRPGAR